MLNSKGVFMINKNIEIKLHETYFCNELDVIIAKIIESLSSINSSKFLDLKTPNIYSLALEMIPDLKTQFSTFQTQQNHDLAQLNESRLKSTNLYNKICNINSGIKCYSISQGPNANSMCSHYIKACSDIIYSYELSKKDNLVEILDHVHNFIISVETLKNFNELNEIAEKLDQIESKKQNRKLSIFDLSKKKKLLKALQEQPNYYIFEEYLKIKPHKKDLLTLRTDSKFLKDENGKTLQEYYNQIDNLTLSLESQKKQMQDNLEKYSYENLKLKLASLFKNHHEYLSYFSDNTLPVFLHNVDNYLNHRGYSKQILNVINRALIDFDLTLDTFDMAEQFFKLNNSKKPQWKQVCDSVFLTFVDTNNPPPNIKVEGSKVFIDVSNTPFAFLSTDLQYPEFEKALTSQKSND